MKNIGLSQSINEIERLTSEAARARDKISSLTMLDQDAEFISLGFNCSTAHYLREIGLRKAAYPFDWVFASPEIIIDACNDSFNAFMDKAQWSQHPNVNAVTHKRYHEYFFTHKDPLNITADFDYYRRASDRFACSGPFRSPISVQSDTLRSSLALLSVIVVKNSSSSSPTLS
ncbi:DUF1796 family putative cysteine peptidase [Alteromonas mediterranea]|uniref:DUF1796 family putative cysteine peptidase n=1 Tax=Alteromonas mediterranea TaxID=314275 RepID=UPI0009B77A44|nr:DUF1796 family putative cysteine peptidase [Alteromonas mediterranea]